MPDTYTTPDGQITLIRGNALEILPTLTPQSIDAVITDPPYSSGGFTRGDRNQAPSAKYLQHGTVKPYAEFAGDNRDQRSWVFWCLAWWSRLMPAMKPGAYALQFTDWRQLPATTDILQSAGLVWRGLITWDKGRAARAPHKGYFRHQAEFIPWATLGPCNKAIHDGPFDGVHQITLRQAEKEHMTAKPLELMRRLVRTVPPGGLVVDPFGGSYTTPLACLLEGRRCISMELTEAYHAIGVERIKAALAGHLDTLPTLSESAA